MRVLAIADVEESWLTTNYDRARMEGVELIVSCGDLPARYLEHVVTLANVPLVYVPGNHDTTFSVRPPEGCVPIDTRLRSCNGLRMLGLGGSFRYNDRIVGYTENEMYWRMLRPALAAKAAGGVDLVVTHAPVRGYGDLDDLPHQGFSCFNTLLELVRPRYLFHGHVHLSYGRIERVHEHPSGTTIVNVCGAQIIDLPDPPARRRSRLFDEV